MVNIRWVSVIQKGICSGWPSSDSLLGIHVFEFAVNDFEFGINETEFGIDDLEFNVDDLKC